MTSQPELTLVFLAAGHGRRFGGCKPLAPVGPDAEALVDIVANDALAVGLSRVVLVVNPESGPSIRSHVHRHWPSDIAVDFAIQERPTGTVPALMAARRLLNPRGSFIVANADDIYGQDAFTRLARHLTAPEPDVIDDAVGETHYLVTYRLCNTLVSDDPVTRGVCDVDDSNRVTRLTERRFIGRNSSDGTIRSLDGHEPELLSPGALVSMNLWGFRHWIWQHFDEAIANLGPSRADRVGNPSDPPSEILLPEVIGSLLQTAPSARGHRPVFRALATDGRCIGVTHASDLPVVRSELVTQVALGLRGDEMWSRTQRKHPVVSNAAAS